MVDARDDGWLLDRFVEQLDLWIDREVPGDDVRVRVTAWVLSRSFDPFAGARREPGFDNLWVARVPESSDDTGRVVTCSYWIDARRRTVRCNSFATLSWPV